MPRQRRELGLTLTLRRGVGFQVIDSVDLRESARDNPCFETNNLPCLILFVSEYPPAHNDVAISGSGDNLPCFILHERVVFFLCSGLPLLPVVRMVDSLLIHDRFFSVVESYDASNHCTISLRWFSFCGSRRFSRSRKLFIG